jgi:hypothetical protein
LRLVTSSPTGNRIAQRRKKIPALAAFEQGVAQVASRQCAGRQPGNFLPLYGDDFVQNVHNFIVGETGLSVQSGNIIPGPKGFD